MRKQTIKCDNMLCDYISWSITAENTNQGIATVNDSNQRHQRDAGMRRPGRGRLGWWSQSYESLDERDRRRWGNVSHLRPGGEATAELPDWERVLPGGGELCVSCCYIWLSKLLFNLLLNSSNNSPTEGSNHNTICTAKLISTAKPHSTLISFLCPH